MNLHNFNICLWPLLNVGRSVPRVYLNLCNLLLCTYNLRYCIQSSSGRWMRVNIRGNIGETGWVVVDWIDLAQDRNNGGLLCTRWRRTRLRKMRGICWPAEKQLDPQNETECVFVDDGRRLRSTARSTVRSTVRSRSCIYILRTNFVESVFVWRRRYRGWRKDGRTDKGEITIDWTNTGAGTEIREGSTKHTKLYQNTDRQSRDATGIACQLQQLTAAPSWRRLVRHVAVKKVKMCWLPAETCGLTSSDCTRATFKAFTAAIVRLKSSGSSDVIGIAKS
jgi:hypothetical protein